MCQLLLEGFKMWMSSKWTLASINIMDSCGLVKVFRPVSKIQKLEHCICCVWAEIPGVGEYWKGACVGSGRCPLQLCGVCVWEQLSFGLSKHWSCNGSVEAQNVPW